MVLNFELEYLEKELKKLNPKKILVQLPEGVKQNIVELKEFFDKLKIEVVFSGETCWGGCSIAVEEAKEVRADLIVHFGHAKFVEMDFPVLYIPIRDNLEIDKLLKESLGFLKNFTRIGFSYSIQHKHELEKIINFYKENNKKIILSKKEGNVSFEGHIVGCQYSGLKAIENRVDCFVILGNQFHSMGASLAVDKPVILIDVYNDEVRLMKDIKNKILKQRFIAIEKFKKAKNIGIIVETKSGQKFGAPELLKKLIEAKGKNVFVLTMNEISPDKLMNFYSIDVFVELACPRVAVDDFAKYSKPLLTYREAMVGLGKMSWKEFVEKGVL